MLTNETTNAAAEHCVMQAAIDFVSALKHDCRVLVAVSGGSDSIGLLIALDEACIQAERQDVTLFAATVDHQLRREAADEAVSVGDLCRRLGIAHQTLVWGGEKPSAALMAKARHARYRLLSNHASAIGADCIAVAHTINDQAETLFMRRLRKANGDDRSMTGMAAQTLVLARHWVVRPFLTVARADVRAMLRAKAVGWADDPSNDDDHYERVRVRKALSDQGQIVWLAGQAQTAEQTRAALSSDAARLFETACIIHACCVAELELAALKPHREASRYLLNALVAIIGGRAYGPSGDALDQVERLMNDEAGGRMTAGRCLFETQSGRLFILREGRDVPESTVETGEAIVWDGRFRLQNIEASVMRVTSAKLAGAVQPGLFDGLEALPPGIRRSAVAALPYASNDDGPVIIDGFCFLAPFDVFLPVFDLAFAQNVAKAFRHPCYSSPSPAFLLG